MRGKLSQLSDAAAMLGGGVSRVQAGDGVYRAGGGSGAVDGGLARSENKNDYYYGGP